MICWMLTINNCLTFLYEYRRSRHIRMVVDIIRSLNLPLVNCVLTFDQADSRKNSRSYKLQGTKDKKFLMKICVTLLHIYYVECIYLA